VRSSKVGDFSSMTDEDVALVLATRVKLATTNDIPRMAISLARAFHGDPLLVWMLPKDRRHMRAVAMFTFLLESQINVGQTYSTADDVGAAIWSPPGQSQFDHGRSAESVEQFRSIIGANLTRAIEVYAALDRERPTDSPHWYLATLGTHPDWQGSGIGTALMEPVLSRADNEGAPAYLESSKESNIPYYRRFGFDVTAEIHLPNGGPTVWPMWREPQPT
jgi:ribosomal protein S18 acetylase RimI-like enzyme